MDTEPPSPAFKRYRTGIDRSHSKRALYRLGPARWWPLALVVVALAGAFALASWMFGRAAGAW